MGFDIGRIASQRARDAGHGKRLTRRGSNVQHFLYPAVELGGLPLKHLLQCLRHDAADRLRILTESPGALQFVYQAHHIKGIAIRATV